MAENLENMDTMKLRWGHYRVLLTASFGQFLGTGIATLAGIILPLIKITDSGLPSISQGLLCSSELIGIMVGSFLIGKWSDRWGYLIFFRITPIIILISSFTAYLSGDILVLGIMLFLMGFGVGGEYSLDPSYISEIMPKKWIQRMLGISKATSALGCFLVAFASLFLLKRWHNSEYWNYLLLIISIISLIMFISRISFAESPGWLLSKGNKQGALKAVQYFLGKDVCLGDIPQVNTGTTSTGAKISDLFNKKNLTRTVLGGIPWACEGVGVYVIGIFTPILIIELGLNDSQSQPFDFILSSIRTTTIINIFIIVGFILGLIIMNHINHLRLQIYGFRGCAISMSILIIGFILKLPVWINLLAFIFFEISLNAGPHLMTFIIPSVIFNVSTRAQEVGICAAIGKAGAILGVMFFPILLKSMGVTAVLAIIVFIQIIGGIITNILGRKLKLI